MQPEKAICSLKMERSAVPDPVAMMMDNREPGHTEHPQEYLEYLDLRGPSKGSAATICSP